MNLITALGASAANTSTTRVVLFPHAGGTPRSYRHIAAALPNMRVDAVTYPGRDHLLDRQPAPSIEAIAAEVTQELSSDTDNTELLILVGHSLGAFIAYETTAALEELHRPQRVVLVASGQNPPLPRGSTATAPTPTEDEDIIADIVRQNPATAQVWADPHLREFFLPAVRADYQLLHGYVPSGRLVEQIHVVAPRDDEEIDHGLIDQWQQFSRHAVPVTEVPGGHMYLENNGDLLAEVILAASNNSAAGEHTKAAHYA
ncbi:Phenyloxazoline synthase MbtB [Dermatophilus congolensis]|uniref:Phenyloxazoline synthase MbtB n=1 Tax=Dermatophilus congolensis TaxID=1863 RepID=A0A239VLI9_9MICO|nr:alpha/beta fold hydrolase [Dermatophilus congolensis]SNV22630.1 Phenyloxazoline synthase MbtB [Dermatophilus congolensis]